MGPAPEKKLPQSAWSNGYKSASGIRTMRANWSKDYSVKLVEAAFKTKVKHAFPRSWLCLDNSDDASLNKQIPKHQERWDNKKQKKKNHKKKTKKNKIRMIALNTERNH